MYLTVNFGVPSFKDQACIDFSINFNKNEYGIQIAKM